MDKLINLKKKILYRSNYRGTKEMDILLSSFVNFYIEKLNEKDLENLLELLNNEDEILYNFYRNIDSDKTLKNNKILQLFKDFKL
ncbi:succinate dehydrogenase assembly factor 2 [Pelagibacteraceae bacterium]|nr:succinate dehydrogenase assembly factor 2 [Pelagibacteraceae bacterium]